MQRPATVQLVLATTDSESTTTQYLHQNGLRFDRIINLSPQEATKLRIPGTPTLLLVNRAGVVERMWFGRLDAAGERDVQAAVLSGG